MDGSIRRLVQTTLEGFPAEVTPNVRTSDGHMLKWDRGAIVRQLMRESKLAEKFYGDVIRTIRKGRNAKVLKVEPYPLTDYMWAEIRK